VGRAQAIAIAQERNPFHTSTGDYDERCLESDMAERCSLANSENRGDNNCESYENYENYENYNNCGGSDECSQYSGECQNQYQDNECSNQYYYDDGSQQQHQPQVHYVETKGPEILYKSSKELYKVVAKECGITCKMTDTCR